MTGLLKQSRTITKEYVEFTSKAHYLPTDEWTSSDQVGFDKCSYYDIVTPVFHDITCYTEHLHSLLRQVDTYVCRK